METIPNGSFEGNDANGVPFEWSRVLEGGGATSSLDTTDPAHGAKCFLASASGSGRRVYLENDAFIPCSPLADVILEYMMKSATTDGSNSVLIDWYKSDETPSSITAQTEFKHEGAEGSSAIAEISTANILAATSFEGTFSPFWHVSVNEGGAKMDLFPDATAPDGDYSLRYTLPNGMGGGLQTDLTGYSPSPARDEIKISFFVKFSPGFTWNQSIQKLIYFKCGTLGEANHILGVHYDYPAAPWVHRLVGWSTQHESKPLGDLNQIEWGGDVNLLTTNVWHKIEAYLKINTPGVYNGIGKIWFNDAFESPRF